MKLLIDECLTEIDSMCTLFIKDNWRLANASLGSILNKLQEILQDMTAKQKESESTSIDSYTHRFLNIIEVVNQAMENKDGIQIADLMGYDMKNLLTEYKNEIV